MRHSFSFGRAMCLRFALPWLLLSDASSAEVSHLLVDALFFDKRNDAIILPPLSGVYRRFDTNSLTKRSKGARTLLSRNTDFSWCFSVEGRNVLCSAASAADVRSVETWLFTPPTCACQRSDGLPTGSQILTHKPAHQIGFPSHSRCYCTGREASSQTRVIQDIRITQPALRPAMRPPNATSALSLECPVGIPQRDKPRKVFVGFTVNDETGPLLTHVHEIAPVGLSCKAESISCS